MALLSSRSDGRDSAKGALEPNVAGDQWSEKQNTIGFMAFDRSLDVCRSHVIKSAGFILFLLG